jgi:hypothetical protein
MGEKRVVPQRRPAPQQPPPVCGVASVLAPFVGLLLGLLALPVAGYWTTALGWGLGILGGSLVVGFICAMASLDRGERPWGLAVLGLLLNGVPLGLLLVGMIASLGNR